ncbi:OLC1v1035646C1 [Oldenlandia corymbosa var. corymbosa]|uniref:OLC1v1035646C1 n=1 Tax=Oldenlandia corymbosa var. corymbosa TaxID=529605 RepID=A0AAV1CTH0_OLDCO|nr:OLC1v1035646C1 [Oldenlandia corymbosa var. corymbosa]
MTSVLGLLCLFPLLIFSCCAGSWPEEDTPSVYEALAQYDFPVGLLPEGATGYDLNPSTGEFSAYLKGTCTFMLANTFHLKYESTMSGIITKDRLENLRGVHVKLVRLWLRIKEVRRDGDYLVFSVGFTTANFPVKDFSESPRCGCGFSCIDVAAEDDTGIDQNWQNLYVFMNSTVHF